VDHSVRGEGDFNEQERRTLENATTGWWKSNGVDFKENKNIIRNTCIATSVFFS
jgi:hypothetical protein